MASKLLNNILQLIDNEHKQLCKNDLPRIRYILDGLIKQEGADHIDLFDVSNDFDELRTEIDIHVLEEDQFLLPITRQVLSDQVKSHDDLARVDKTIRNFSHQHDDFDKKCGRLIETINTIHVHQDYELDRTELIDLLCDVKILLQRHHEKEHQLLFPALLQRCQELLQQA